MAIGICLPGAGASSLRESHCSSLLQGGYKLHKVQLLGHVSLALVSRQPERWLRSESRRVISCESGTSSHGDGHGEDVKAGVWTQRVEALGEALSSLFPVWVGLACVSALVKPDAFLWIKGQLQMLGITITMLGMGMTLSMDDLRGAFSMPKEVAAGVFLQYTIMPASGALVAHFMRLPSPYAAGLVLVACCPGGTASNVVTYLARGNVALSVLMTTISTFLAVVMTPLLTSKLAGQYVAVDARALVLSTLQVVLFPVMAGACMAHYLPGLVRAISPLAPTVAVVTIAAIVASAIAPSASAITSSGAQVVLAVGLLHASGFLLGYVASKTMRLDESSSRTISIEVGMQNSVLGVVLANQHFASPLTAVPCAVSSVCHSVFGSALAGFWRATSR